MTNGAAQQTGSGGAEKTEPATSTEQATTQTPSASGGKTAEQRINEVTGEYSRKLEKATRENEQLQKQLQEVIEKHKTEDDKRLDALVDAAIESRYGDKLQRLDKLHTQLQDMADKAVEELPENARGFVTAERPEERLQQALAARNILASFGNNEPSTGGPANPPGPTAKSTYTWAQFKSWQNKANDPDPVVRKEFKDQAKEMKAAYKEGRIR